MKNYIYKHDRLKMTNLSLVFDAGSTTEEPGKYGTMHLMEHLICKTFEDLYHTLTKNGIDWNASTNSEKVIVYFSGLSSILNSDLKLELVNRITGGLDKISKEAFEKERDVVLQEYMDCVFDNSGGSFMNMQRKYWDYYGAIGREEDIRNFSYEDMLETYEKRFRVPARIVEIGPEKTVEFETMFKEREHSKSKVFKYGNYSNELVSVDNSLKTCAFMLFKKTVKPSDYPYLNIGLQMLTSGMESPYYQEIRVKRGLSYYVCGYIDNSYDSANMMITACTNSDKYNELKCLLEELSNRTIEFLTQERFDDIISRMKINKEKQKVLKYANAEKYLNITRFKMPENLDKIDLDKVRYVMSRYFAKIEIV